MKIKLEVKNRVITVRLIGELDHHSTEDVRNAVEELIKDKGIYSVVFDLSELEFMDSSGIGLLVGRYKLVAPLGGSVSVVARGGNIEKIIRMSGVEKLMKLYKSTDEAIKAVCGGNKNEN